MSKPLSSAKVVRILSVLQQYPDGLHIREISRRTGIPVSTVHYYFSRHLEKYVDEIVIGPKENPFVRLVKLKKGDLKKRVKYQLLLDKILSEGK